MSIFFNTKKIHTITPLDSETAPFKALTLAYPQTFNSWRNMKQRIKTHGAIVHANFDSFKDFLKHMGPCEKKTYTLDRINNDDPEYAPGKVAWRDKYTQNSNKGDNIFLTYKGKTKTIAQWAVSTKQEPSTLYKRKDKGWSAEAIITGVKNTTPLNTGTIVNPFPYSKEDIWEQRYIEHIGKSGYCSKLVYAQNQGRIYETWAKDQWIELSNQIEQPSISVSKESIENLHAQLEKYKAQYFQYKKLFQETSQQINYEEKRDNYFNQIQKFPKNSRKELMDKYFEINPRPNYTINQPEI